MELIEQYEDLSIKRKCEMLDVNRSTYYYEPEPVPQSDIDLMNEMRDIYTQYPFFGYRKIHAMLTRKGYVHNLKKSERLVKLAGLRAVYPAKKTTIRNKNHAVYPYLLKDMDIVRPNQVWQVDITYIKLRVGFVYLVCLIDVFSRRVMGAATSTFLDTESCIYALSDALMQERPEIVNSDQGCQFTSNRWIETLNASGISISMDGKGRWADNVFIERFWRSIKYEMVYLHAIDTVMQAKNAIAEYIYFYNNTRPHQALDYKTPNEIFCGIKHVKSIEREQDSATPFIEVQVGSQILDDFLS